MSATRAKATGSTPENQASRLSLIPPTPLSKGLVIDFFVLGDVRHVAECQYRVANLHSQLKLTRQQPSRTNALGPADSDHRYIPRATGKSPGRPCLRPPPFHNTGMAVSAETHKCQPVVAQQYPQATTYP